LKRHGALQQRASCQAGFRAMSLGP
jgi:hypothetical protein